VIIVNKNGFDSFFDSFLQNLLWGIQDGGFSMFTSIASLLVWILGAILNSF